MRKNPLVSSLVLMCLFWGAAFFQSSIANASTQLANWFEPQLAPTFSVASVLPGTSGRRVYMIHGLNRDHRQFARETLVPLVEGMKRRGDELVFVDLPKTRAGFFKDGGAVYCDSFRRWLAADMAARAPANTTTLLGVSLGGWHALVAGDMADSVVALMPVTDISALREFPYMATAGCPLRKSRGIAIYSPKDPRVGDGTAALRATGLKMHVKADDTHGVAPVDIEDALAYR